MPMKWSLVTPRAQNWETETRVLSPSAGRRRVLSSNCPRLPWCVGVMDGRRGDCDGCADRFNAGKTLGAADARA